MQEIITHYALRITNYALRIIKKFRRARRFAELFAVVGATGLEPAASCSQSKHSTKLSYAPINSLIYNITFESRCQAKMR